MQTDNLHYDRFLIVDLTKKPRAAMLRGAFSRMHILYRQAILKHDYFLWIRVHTIFNEPMSVFYFGDEHVRKIEQYETSYSDDIEA